MNAAGSVCKPHTCRLIDYTIVLNERTAMTALLGFIIMFMSVSCIPSGSIISSFIAGSGIAIEGFENLAVFVTYRRSGDGAGVVLRPFLIFCSDFLRDFGPKAGRFARGAFWY